MKNTLISRFTPSLMAPETLEAILVQRHELANYLVDKIRNSATTDNRHYQLLIGPRGIGKTHLVSLIYHRIANREDLQNRLLIAWLREEEYGIASFLDLLIAILRAIGKEYPDEYQAQLYDAVEKLYDLSPEDAESVAAQLLRDFIGNRVLLLIVENLDDVFSGLGDIGQNQFRAYIQNYGFLTILATSQSLFDGIESRDKPFYGFFYPHNLNELALDDAVNLLKQIASLEGKSELAAFIQDSTGRNRIKVVHFLSGGSPRIYMVFSDFLVNRESLNGLVEAFMAMLDDLTPYYQDRMKYISNQQRKIVDFLADLRRATPVKEIAKRCFITHQTASSQLKDLRQKGYVKSEEIGRESWYELREPLMRFCLEVKKQRNEPIRLFVDFLRVWYTQEELQQRLGLRMAEVDFGDKESDFEYRRNLEPIPPDAVMEREYYRRALEAIERNEEDPLLKAYFDEIEYCREQKDDVSALAYLDRAIEIDSNYARAWRIRGDVLDDLERYEEALASFDKAIEIKPDDAINWNNKSWCLRNLKRYHEALASCDKAIELDPNLAMAWYNQGMTLDEHNNNNESLASLASLNKAIELDPSLSQAWANRGVKLNNLGRYEEGLVSLDKAIEIAPKYANAWSRRGWSLNKLKRYEDALNSYKKALEIDDKDAWNWANLGDLLNNLKRYEEALVSFDQTIKLDPNDRLAWRIRGNILDNLKRYEEALVSLDKAIKLDANDRCAWGKRGDVLDNLERYDEALASYDKAIALDANYHCAWRMRGNVLYKLERYEEALTSFDKAIELDSNDRYAWDWRGNVLNNLECYEEALASYDRLIELDVNYQFAWVKRGVILNNLKRYEEALASYDKAIALDPNDQWSWTNRGYIMGKQGYFLGKQEYYEEALLSFNKTIEFDEQDKYAWNNRGWVLCRLGRYDQALISLEKAIELGFSQWYAFFNRAESLLAMNQWDEGITALDDAIYRFTQEDMTEIDNTEAIVRNLFNNTSDIAICKTRIKTLIELYNKHNIISILGQAIVRNIPALMSDMVSDKAARTWLELWQEPTSNYEQFQIPIRLLNAAVRYKETKGDRRVLLELPIEERNLLEPLVSGKVE